MYSRIDAHNNSNYTSKFEFVYSSKRSVFWQGLRISLSLIYQPTQNVCVFLMASSFVGEIM